MNTTIIDRLNSRVHYDDTLYLLGDVIMGKDIHINLPKIMDRINCHKIHLVYGNHDTKIKQDHRLQALFTSCQDYLELRYSEILFCMCHYPMGSWNEIGRGAINTYGHCHSTYKDNKGRQIDVGVDTNDFYPYNIDEIIEKMNKIEPTYVDHHTKSTSYN